MTDKANSEDQRIKILFDVTKKLAGESKKDWVLAMSYEDFVEGLNDLGQREKETLDATLAAMHEYMTTCCKEMLEWMAKNNIECYIKSGDGPVFYTRVSGEMTKDELFENFL